MLLNHLKEGEIIKQKQKAIDNQILADQLIRGFNIIMNGNENSENTMKQLWDYYPELFEEEKVFFEIKKEENDFENFKANRRKFANQYNRKFRGGGD